MRRFTVRAGWLWIGIIALGLGLLSTVATRPTGAASTWGGATPLTATGRNSLVPDIIVDSNGVIHVVYSEADLDFGVNRQILYSNNASGSFSTLRVISGNVTGNAGQPRIATALIGGVTRVYVTFEARINPNSNDTSRIWSVVSNNAGANFGAPVDISPGLRSFAPAITVEPNGTQHVVFGYYPGDAEGGAVINVYYTTNSGSGWTTPVFLASRQPGASYNSFAAIGHTVINNVTTLHVLFMGQLHGQGELGKAVFSMRKVGNDGWTQPQLRQDGGSNFPKISVNGSIIYATWQNAGGGSNFEPIQTVSTDNGVNWSAPTSRGNGAGDVSARPDIAAAGDGSVMMVWDDISGASDSRPDIWSAYSPNGSAWNGAVRIFRAPGFSVEVEVAGSCSNFHAVWHDNPDGAYRIYYAQTGGTRDGCVAPTATPALATPTNQATNTPTNTPSPTPTNTPSPTPTPITPAGVLVLNNGANFTNNATLTGRLTNNGGPASTYALTGDVTQSGAFTPDLQNGMTLQLALTNPQQCQRYTIAGQLTGSGRTSPLFSDSITYDAQVDVNVRALNLATNGRSISVLDNPSNYGDPNYTGLPVFGIQIDPTAAECSGVDDYIIGQTGETGIPAASDSRWRSVEPGTTIIGNVPGNQTQGNYFFRIFVRDNAGNVVVRDANIIYDSTPPNVLAGTNNVVSTTAVTPVSDVVRLDLSTLVVTDNLYPSGNQAYYGVWVLVNNNPTTDASSSDWVNFGTVVPGKVGSTFDWNLVLGSNRAPLLPGQNYYVHLRFIDGGGNASGTPIHSQGVVPTAFSSLRQAFLPFVQR